MMKRIIALLLALILTVGLLPTVALAAEGENPTTDNSVVTGKIVNGNWSQGAPTQDKPSGVITVNKTAEKVPNTDNQYKVTLTVVLEQTAEEQKPGAAATVLVLDTSGSMAYCAECGESKDCEHSYKVFEGTANSSGEYFYKDNKGEYQKAYYCDGKDNKKHDAGWYKKKDHRERSKLINPTIYEKKNRISRLDAAKSAAQEFLKTYSGLKFDTNGALVANQTDRNLGRYVSVVTFATGVTLQRDWIDVSNPAGYESVLGVFTGNSLKADGGTNLDAGLTYAEYLLKQDTVKNATKNVIALTDGEPTYHLSTSWEVGDIPYVYDITIDDTGYYVHGNGGSCDKDTYNTTKRTAATLRNSASVYTVCFGASGNEIKDYDKNGNQKITVGNYLKQKIATQPKSGSNEEFAYDAADAAALNTAFAAITNTIVSGLSTGTVKDTLPTGIMSAAFETASVEWDLERDFVDKKVETKPVAGGTKVTTYTYTKTYTVTIDPDNENLVKTEDGYAPLNGETTLTVEVAGEEKTIPFPIPAGKVTPTKITDKITVTITGATNTETYDGTEKKAEGYTVTISDPRYTTDDFTFSGTNVVRATNASAVQYMMGLKAGDFTNNNEKFTNVEFVVIDGSLTINKKALTIEANDNTVDYDGKPHGEDGYVATGLAEGDTVESVTFNGSQTNPGTYENLLVPSEAVIKNAKGDDVKDNYIITYTPGTLVINKLTNEITVTITGKQETKEYNGQTQEVVGFTYTVEGAAHDDVTVSLKTGKEAKASGKDVLVGTDGKYDATLTYPMHLTADCFDVSSTKYSNVTIKEVKDGWLKITPRAITLKSGSDTKNYDGTALTKDEVTVISGSFVSGEGLDYNVTGSQTVVGTSKNTYNYAAKAGTTLTNYTITQEEGDLTVTLPDLTARPNVIVNCVNTEVPAHTEKNTSLTNADHYTVSTEATKVDGQSAYTRTITLTEAGKNHFISSEYVPEYGSHTPATNGNVTEITMTYSEENGVWAWRASHTNFLLNVECTTPTVEVDLGNYIKKTLTGTNFHENFSAEFKVDVAYSCDGNKTATGSVTLTGAAVNKPFNFDKITLKQGFYYIFAVTERKANVSGVICDTTTHEFALNVKTDGNVEFGSVVDKQFVPAGAEADQFLTITNTYTKPTYAVGKFVIESAASDDFPIRGVNADDYQYPTNGKYIVEKTYTSDTITFLYVIKVSGNQGAVVKIQETDGGEFAIKDSTDSRANIVWNEAEQSYTVTLNQAVDASNPIKLYAKKTFTKVEGKFPTTATNALLVNGEDGPKDNTTIEERGTLTVDFGALVHKHLTVTGDKSFNGATFTVNFTEGLYAPLAVNNSIEVYADAGVGKEKLPDLTASVTYTADERNRGLKDFDGADLTINTEGNYSYIVSEQIPAGATGYDTKKYVVGIVVVPDGDGLKVEHVWYHELVEDLATHPEIIPGGPTFYNTIDTGKDDYYPIIIPTIINKDTGMLNKTDHFAYVIGYPDGTVHPNGQITRAEVATIFFRLLRDEVRDGAFTTSNTYSDVAYGKWYNNPISTMSALGIITGYPDGTFKPNKPITRAEFAAIAARFDETQSGKSATFSDVIGHWAAKEIGIAYYNDWIKGYPDGTFKPDQNITRAEAMTLINRVLERKPESPADLLTNMNKWTDNLDTSKWYYLDVQEATNSHGYTRKTFNYELWRQMLPDPDWSRYER